MTRLYEGRLVAEDITDFNHYRWREGLICFEDMPFTELMTKFERCYGIKIVVQNPRVKNYKPTGKFRHADGIDYALRVLQRNFLFKYERDDENHVIYIK
jgi:ferric-dicitrate binding protein FerR (iron transport regulator)